MHNTEHVSVCMYVCVQVSIRQLKITISSRCLSTPFAGNDIFLWHLTNNILSVKVQIALKLV